MNGGSAAGAGTGRAELIARSVTFLLLLVIVLTRGWERLARPDLWGEDGQVFLRQAFDLGFGSLLRPVAGSYFTLERLLMLAALHLGPLARLPWLICAVSYVILAAVMSGFSTAAYAWLIPSRAVRVTIACLFCLLPGLNEMAGNLCNLNWIFFCWLALAALKDPSARVTRLEVVITVFVTASTGASILLVPLFAWRLLTVPRSSTRRALSLEAAQLAIVILCGVALPLFAARRPPPSPIVSYLDVARICYDHLVRVALFTPWIGERLTYRLSDTQPSAIYGAGKIAFLLFVAGWGWMHRRDCRIQAMLLLLAGVGAWSVLAILARPYGLEAFYSEHGPLFYENRYSFPLSFVAPIFWLTIAPSSRRQWLPVAMVGVLIGVNLTQSLHRYAITAYGVERRWASSVAALDTSIRTGCPRQVNVRQYPASWEFSYRSTTAVVECR